MEERKAIVFDIGRFRNTDGPGIRTIVFFKGCPLKCKWCSNALGLSSKPQLAVNFDRCTACGKCVEVCQLGVNSIVNGKLNVDFSLCQTCGDCIVPCPQDTRMISGKEYTARELYEEAAKDSLFYRKGDGGITLSGGELLVHHEVAAETLRLCRKNYINTCIETSAFGKWEHLKSVAKWSNLIFVDLKHIDSKIHKEITGVPLEPILENIKKLDEYILDRDTTLIIRRPIIPSYNEDDETSIGIAQFVSELKSKPEINLLPYHNLGESKYEMIGEEYQVDPSIGMLDKSDKIILNVKNLTEKFAPNNRVSVGGDNIELN